MLFLTMEIGRHLGLALAVGLEVDFSVVWVVSLSLFSLGFPPQAKAVPAGGNHIAFASPVWRVVKASLRSSLSGHLSAFSVRLPQQLAISEAGILCWTVSGGTGEFSCPLGYRHLLLVPGGIPYR